jgi:hypothetical protein
MKNIFPLLLIVFLFGCKEKEPELPPSNPQPVLPISKSIGKININDTMSVRLLVLKHCPDDIADTDSNQAIAAVNLGASKGLNIENIGNYHVDKEGMTNSIVWAGSLNDLVGLKRFVSEQMKVGAKAGDTLIIYTIGHGSGSGSVMRLGQREGIVKAFAEAAEENNQETFWWQLSCHAAAKLPEISSLTEKQQRLFSMTASSPGNELSYFTTQGKLMEVVFTAMAAGGTDIDPNQDCVITAGELKQFMIAKFGAKRGGLVWAKNDDEGIFNLVPGLIPITDHNGEQKKYPNNYVPVPR